MYQYWPVTKNLGFEEHNAEKDAVVYLYYYISTVHY